MEIRVEKREQAVVVTLGGRMDVVSTPEYQKEMEALILSGERKFVVDLGGLDYVSSAGLRGFLLVAKQLQAQGGELFFTGLKGAVRDVFQVSGFAAILKVRDATDDALRLLA